MTETYVAHKASVINNMALYEKFCWFCLKVKYLGHSRCSIIIKKKRVEGIITKISNNWGVNRFLEGSDSGRSGKCFHRKWVLSWVVEGWKGFSVVDEVGKGIW